MKAPFDAVVVHYAEIGLKGRNRTYFEHMLRDNIAPPLGPLAPRRRGAHQPAFGNVRVVLVPRETAFAVRTEHGLGLHLCNALLLVDGEGMLEELLPADLTDDALRRRHTSQRRFASSAQHLGS
jgi:hypothetical protein